MAIRRPLKLHSGNLRDMTTAEVELIVDEVIRQYGENPSITLQVLSGTGDLNPITERRATAGALAIASFPWPSAEAIGSTEVTYENTKQMIPLLDFPYRNTGSKNYENFSYPVYRTAGGDIQAMDRTDIYDTFIQPAIAKLTLGSTTPEGQAGTYFISTSTIETGATLVNFIPVAKDTISDIAAFNAGSLPENLDQPDANETNFWVHRVDPVAGVNYTTPVCLKIDTSDLQAVPKPFFGSMLQDLVRYHAAQTIRYNYYLSTDTSFGVARGTGITDSYTTNSTTRFEQPNATTYYAQNVPSGTPTVQRTYYLRLGTV